MEFLGYKVPGCLPENRIYNVVRCVEESLETSVAQSGVSNKTTKCIGHQFFVRSFRSALGFHEDKTPPLTFRFPFDYDASETKRFISSLVKLLAQRRHFSEREIGDAVASSGYYKDYPSLLLTLEVYSALSRGDWSVLGKKLRIPKHFERDMEAGIASLPGWDVGRYGELYTSVSYHFAYHSECELYIGSTDSYLLFPAHFRNWGKSKLDLLHLEYARIIVGTGPEAWNLYVRAASQEGAKARDLVSKAGAAEITWDASRRLADWKESALA